MAGSNGRSWNSDSENSTDLQPEGQERVSVILLNRSVIADHDAVFPWDNYYISCFQIKIRKFIYYNLD